MRVFLLAGTVLLGAAAAQAGSIDVVRSDNREHSIEHVTCAACGPYSPEVEDVVEDIALEPGQQRIEVRDVNGEKKIFRTEAWFGGSPVVMVSKAYELPGANQAADAEQPTLIDPGQTTSVNADMSSPALPVADKPEATVPEAKAFDPQKLELRLK